jgi:hypothetical protein
LQHHGDLYRIHHLFLGEHMRGYADLRRGDDLSGKYDLPSGADLSWSDNVS